MLTFKRRWSFVAATAVVLVPATAGSQDAPPAPPTPTVVKTERIGPQRILVLRSTFHPAAYPPPRTVRWIIDYEAARVGASSAHLRSRVACESGFSWWATNGQFVGVGQFAYETFYRGVRSLDTRVVAIRVKRWVAKRVTLLDTYSDGSTKQRPGGWKVRQLVVHHYRGKIPRTPPQRHTWAQIRIMSLAMVGRSAVRDSEWTCR